MVAPLVIGGAVAAGAGLAGGIGQAFKKKPSIDITQQLAQLHSGIGQQQIQNEDLSKNLKPLTQDYRANLQAALSGQKADFTGAKSDYLGATNNNIEEAKNALRGNLYGSTFNGLPDALQAVREASAAGGGLRTGSYQKAVNDIGRTTAQTLAQGEGNIQAQGMQMKNDAQTQAFNAFNALESRLSDQQMQGLTKVLDTGREDLIRQYTTSMGLTEQETQGVIDLLNFKQSGQMASDSAADANKMALFNALLGGGGKLMAGGK